MIRTALILIAVFAPATAAFANVPAQVPPYGAEAISSAECTEIQVLRTECVERDVTRGHADLSRRYVVPANNEQASAA